MGAFSGIGRQTALDFAAQGARVVAAARDREALDSLAAEVRVKGGAIQKCLADTSDFLQVRSVAQAAVEHFGDLETWVHVAGIAIYARVRADCPGGVSQGLWT